MKIENYLKASPVYTLARCQERIIYDVQRELKSYDMHFMQALLLVAVFFEGRPCRPSELAEALQLSRSAVSHAVSGLESQRLIRRKPSPEDARGFLLDVTAAGKKKVLNLVRYFDDLQYAFEKQLGESWVQDFNRDMETLMNCYESREQG